MPILVQWKWQEKSKSFLVIFHFHDDFSKTNLRLKGRQLFGLEYGDKLLINYPISEKTDPALERLKKKNLPIMTWAPSHTEIALLSDLLNYANIIGGLSEDIRRNLRHKLEIVEKEQKEDKLDVDWNAIDALLKRLSNPSMFVGLDRGKESVEEYFCCFELCPEYLEYLKETLKPYL